ncbi:hypothetical protein L202_01043 [Cryptococcus amylolentus CBS 6039]|uniref:Uncharacterized protein n=2 Tax=Cryptococcus amylolentus TaxID=104669 RepID=A0A1E3I337_9TREE|nr:hypothetical protein L202_01043 [Cryptococcus amylolentus CBS 6039]ODN82765.1 hypothetical protein L202_01043 [Cryptococcus amylolentus CBS 6039]ODO10438.1 hypothetical protein I350_01033 [Cryptococcus amylolentus CBS 6273]
MPSSSSPPPSHLPVTHPALLEITSLRSQLAQYQSIAHTSSIQLQGSRLETSLTKDKLEKTHRVHESLLKELEILRANPPLPPVQSGSQALTELSLAHRRLSSKLDLTESRLLSTSSDLASAKHALQRIVLEREEERRVLSEVKRVEWEKEEEVEWEKGERGKAEGQLRLLELALEEYKKLVHKLDPNAVPPDVPAKPTLSWLTSSVQADAAGIDKEAHPSTKGEETEDDIETSKEAISNLLIGQRGVAQLFHDFTTSLTSKDALISSLQSQIDALNTSLATVEGQLKEETARRVEVEEEKEKVDRDDKSAAGVVERYMTFTQKTHKMVYMHLDNQRTRSQATITALRTQVGVLKTQLAAEAARAQGLRAALDELSFSSTRESAGRRREIALRLRMIAEEEKRAKKVETWSEKVKRLREGVEGAVLEADVLEGLLDEGLEAASGYLPSLEAGGIDEEKRKSWRGILPRLRKRSSTHFQNGDRDPAEESLARVLLAEDLVTTLAQDLQVEHERRMELERQRVEWLAKDAVEGVKIDGELEDGGEESKVWFDMEGEGDEKDQSPKGLQVEVPPPETFEKPASPMSEPSSEPSSPSPSPEISTLHTLFDPIQTRYSPLQRNLHDLSLSLSSLRGSITSDLPPTPSSPTMPTSGKKASFLPLARLPLPSPGIPGFGGKMSAQTTLETLSDALHEVIEDARVDVEIALADIERVYRGFEALLDVSPLAPNPKVRSEADRAAVLGEAEGYVKHKEEGDEWKRLERKVGEVEADLAGLKRVLHSLEGMALESQRDDEEENVWQGVRFKTISLHPRHPSPLPTPLVSPLPEDQSSPFPFLSPSSSTTSLVFPTSARPPHIRQASLTGIGARVGGTEEEGRRRTSSMNPMHIGMGRGMLASVGNVGRSFSAGVVGGGKRVGGLASGLYKGTGDKPDVVVTEDPAKEEAEEAEEEEESSEEESESEELVRKTDDVE